MALLSLYAQSLIGTSFSSEASVSDLLALLGSRTEGRNEEMVATARQRPGGAFFASHLPWYMRLTLTTRDSRSCLNVYPHRVCVWPDLRLERRQGRMVTLMIIVLHAALTSHLTGADRIVASKTILLF